MTESTERMGYCERCGRLLLATAESSKPTARLQCGRCSDNMLRTSLGLRGGLIAASLFGLSLQAPTTAVAQPPNNTGLFSQPSPPVQPLYGVAPPQEPIITITVVEGHIARVLPIEGNSTEVEIEILGVGTDDGASAGHRALIKGLDIATKLTRCEARCCYANVAATEYELTENPKVEVTIVLEEW